MTKFRELNRHDPQAPIPAITLMTPTMHPFIDNSNITVHVIKK